EDGDAVPTSIPASTTLEPDSPRAYSRINGEVDRERRIELRSEADMYRFVEHREPGARCPRPQAEVIALEDPETHRLKLVEQGVGRIVPARPPGPRKRRSDSARTGRITRTTISVAPADQRTSRTVLQVRAAPFIGAPLQHLEDAVGIDREGSGLAPLHQL